MIIEISKDEKAAAILNGLAMHYDGDPFYLLELAWAFSSSGVIEREKLNYAYTILWDILFHNEKHRVAYVIGVIISRSYDVDKAMVFESGNVTNLIGLNVEKQIKDHLSLNTPEMEPQYIEKNILSVLSGGNILTHHIVDGTHFFIETRHASTENAQTVITKAIL